MSVSAARSVSRRGLPANGDRSVNWFRLRETVVNHFRFSTPATDFNWLPSA